MQDYVSSSNYFDSGLKRVPHIHPIFISFIAFSLPWLNNGDMFGEGEREGEGGRGREGGKEEGRGLLVTPVCLYFRR